MFRNYFKSAFRYLWSHKIFSVINLVGLATGICVCFFALLYVRFELGYDSYHEKAGRIYRLVTDVKTSTGVNYESSSAPMGPAIQAAFPEVQASARVFLDNLIIEKDDRHFNDEEIAYADSSLFSVFTFPLIAGNPGTALNAPYSLVLSETAAKKYFGAVNPVGKTLLVEGRYPAQVTALMKDMPANSHFRTDILVSMSTLLQAWNPSMERKWDRFGFYTYLLLSENADAGRLAGKLPGFVNEHMDQLPAKYSLSLEPLTRVYLYGKARGHRSGSSISGNPVNLYVFSLVAALVLLIAGFNFVNLTTAFSLQRAKEIGVRKVLGASRRQLMAQFLLDAILLSLLAFIAALLLYLLFLPLFDRLCGKTIADPVAGHPLYLCWLLLPAILVGLLAGVYPAFFLSGFEPISTLKGGFVRGSKGLLLRKTLVVTQFSLSIGLIIATLVIHSQLDFMKNGQLGFKKTHNLVVDFHFDGRLIEHGEAIKQRLLDIPGISAATISSGIPGRANRVLDTKIENADRNMQDLQWEPYFIDYDFFRQYQIGIVVGRPFSTAFATDSSGAMLINESAVKSLGYHDPHDAIGRHFSQAGRKGVIIGVVKDFHVHSFREAVPPLTFQLGGGYSTFLTLELSYPNPAATIATLENVWRHLLPDLPLVWFFGDETYDAQYIGEERFGALFICFASLAILISCLGLLGLSAFNTLAADKGDRGSQNTGRLRGQHRPDTIG